MPSAPVPTDLPAPAATFIRKIPSGVLYRCFCSLYATCTAQEWKAGIGGCSCRGDYIAFPKADLRGARFSRLVVTGWKDRGKLHHRWYCACDCGAAEKAIQLSSLQSGATRSCGCLAEEAKRARRGIIKVDLTGRRYGRLTVVGQAERKGVSRTSRWTCQCDCGRSHEASSSDLEEGKVTSCGCAKRDSRSYNLIGFRFHNLVVKGIELDIAKRGRVRWRCDCDCGQSVLVNSGSYLYGGLVHHCGCGLPSKFIKEPGESFNQLTLLTRLSPDMALCQCQCGTIVDVKGEHLFENSIKYSCGCTPSPLRPLNSLATEMTVLPAPASKAPVWQRIDIEAISRGADMVEYVCLCGNKAFTSPDQFSKGINSCFCTGKRIAFPYEDLRGKAFGKLTVKRWIPEIINSKGNRVRQYWECTCECGNQREVKGSALRDNVVTSCGCAKPPAPVQPAGSVHQPV